MRALSVGVGGIRPHLEGARLGARRKPDPLGMGVSLTMLKEVAALALKILQHMQYLHDSSCGTWHPWGEGPDDKMQLRPP
eukprot:4745923-Pyramimonas_sp.AAC.1